MASSTIKHLRAHIDPPESPPVFVRGSRQLVPWQVKKKGKKEAHECIIASNRLAAQAEYRVGPRLSILLVQCKEQVPGKYYEGIR